MKVREAFYAVQGEGARVGEATVFVRFAGCNLDCWFCDTDWKYGEAMSVEDVLNTVGAMHDGHPAQWVTLTGGEPCVQPEFNDLVYALRGLGYHVSVETNGTMWRDALRDCYVTLSPKAKWEGVKAAIADGFRSMSHVDELKVVVEREDRLADLNAMVDALPVLGIAQRFVQPRYDDRMAWENAYNMVRSDPRWRLSLQMHKWLGVR